MSIKKNPRRQANPWEYRWIEEGKHYSRSFHTRKEAELYKTEQKSALHNGTYIRTADENITVDDYAEKFLKQKRKESTSLRHRSIYKLHIKPTFGAVRLKSVLHSDVQELVDSWIDSGLKRRTIDRQLAVLSGIFALAESDGRINRVPTKKIKRPEASAPHRYAMSVEEVYELRKAIHKNYDALLYALVETGMRIGEARNLNIADFDWKAGTLSIAGAKTAAGNRVVRISKTAQELISVHVNSTGRSMVNGSEPLFVSHKRDKESGMVIGTRLIYGNFYNRIFKPAAAQIGLPDLQAHDLRRTTATLLVSNGTPDKVIMERLGHRDIRTTLNLYAQGTEKAHTEAVTAIEGLLALDQPVKKKA